MIQWLITGALYAAAFGLFSLLGGLHSAGDAIRRWGEAAATRRESAAASS
jgi:hypothetical protein